MIPNTSSGSGREVSSHVFAGGRFVKLIAGGDAASPREIAPGRRAEGTPQTARTQEDVAQPYMRAARGEDVVELRSAQERAAKIEQMRGTIANGTYDIMSRLDVAAERLLRELDDSK